VVSRSHTTTHHSRYDSSGRVISSSQRPLPDNTQHLQQTDIYAPDGFRTHDLSRRAAVDLSLRSRGDWDRHPYVYILIYISLCIYSYVYILIYILMYISLCIYPYVYILMYISLYIYILMYISLCIYPYVFILMYISLCIYPYVYILMYISLCIYSYVYILMYISLYISLCIYSYLYILIYISLCIYPTNNILKELTNFDATGVPHDLFLPAFVLHARFIFQSSPLLNSYRFIVITLVTILQMAVAESWKLAYFRKYVQQSFSTDIVWT
jgi:hypothetical protein